MAVARPIVNVDQNRVVRRKREKAESVASPIPIVDIREVELDERARGLIDYPHVPVLCLRRAKAEDAECEQ